MDELLRHEAEGIVELVLNRPAKLNALTLEMYDGLRQAVADLRERSDLRVLLIRATGRYFSAGVDLSRHSTPDFDGSGATARNWMRMHMQGGMQGLYEEMERVEKPIIVAHHAPCVGGGLELSLSCDFRLAARSASYWFPEMQLGMLPLSNGVGRLTRLIGGHWARWMALANERVEADQALAIGLIHRIFPDETFEEDVRNFARRLAQLPAEAVAAGKLAIEMAEDLPADQARQLERLIFGALSLAPGTRDHAEVVRRRLQSRQD